MSMVETMSANREWLVDLADDLATDHADMMAALIQIREQKGLTQAEVGRRMGVSQATVSELEDDDANPTLQRIRRYAQAVRARISTRVVDAEG